MTARVQICSQMTMFVSLILLLFLTFVIAWIGNILNEVCFTWFIWFLNLLVSLLSLLFTMCCPLYFLVVCLFFSLTVIISCGLCDGLPCKGTLLLSKQERLPLAHRFVAIIRKPQSFVYDAARSERKPVPVVQRQATLTLSGI